MNETMSRRVALAIIGVVATGSGGCLGAEIEDDDESREYGAPPPEDQTVLGSDSGDGNSSRSGDASAAGDDAPGDSDPADETGQSAESRESNDPDDEVSDPEQPEPTPDPQAAARATIDYGEPIGRGGDWYGAGGAQVSVDPEETVTESGALRVELDDASFATAGYDFQEPFDLGTRHLSAAVKVEAPGGGELELRLRAPASDRRFVCTRRLPTGMSDWMRVDLGITRGKRSPAADEVRSLRFHVAGDRPGDVRFWIDDLRATESSGESSAILAFYGGRAAHYETVFPLLEERGMQAAVAVSPPGIGASGRMSIEELRELRDAGWDVCSFPARAGSLPELASDEQRRIIGSEQARLANLGFEEGARHFFAPRHRMNGDTIDIVQDLHATGFLYGGNSAGMPPTAPHTLPVINGGDYDSSRSVILRADRHEQLVVLGFDRIGPEGMSVEDLEAQLDRLESNAYAGGLNVITPSELVDNHL